MNDEVTGIWLVQRAGLAREEARVEREEAAVATAAADEASSRSRMVFDT
jgi:hypothetical protein